MRKSTIKRVSIITDALLASLHVSFADIPVTFHKQRIFDLGESVTTDQFEELVRGLYDFGAVSVTFRCFALGKVAAHVSTERGGLRVFLKRIYGDRWKNKEKRMYEYRRIYYAVPEEEVDFEKPWLFYLTKYGVRTAYTGDKYEDVASRKHVGQSWYVTDSVGHTIRLPDLYVHEMAVTTIPPVEEAAI